MSASNEDQKAKEDAASVMNAFMREWKSSNDMVRVKNAVQAWLEKYQTPTYIDILKKVEYIHGDLWDRLNAHSDVFGMNAFIFCGDHMTMNKISDALLSFSREQSLHAEMRELNKDDKIVFIEKKGYFMLSVNGRIYSGVPFFSGGYLRD